VKSPVKLYLRVRLPDRTYPYLKAVFASNGRVRPHCAIHDGKPIHFPGSSYHLRYQVGGKRIWEPVGSEPSLAIVAFDRRTHELQGIALGNSEPVVPVTLPVAKPEGDPTKRLLADCVTKYIIEITEHKAAKTLAAYRLTVFEFCAVVTRMSVEDVTDEEFLKRIALVGTYIEDVTREDILKYSAALRKTGRSPRTVRNRIDHLQIFLHHFGLPSLLTGNDLPKYTDKKVRAYNPLELGKMFSHATQDESDLLHFLLCTGAREQEAQYVCWSDVDLERKTYTVTEHLDLGYRPKDKEEGTLPIPNLLVDVLVSRRKRNPGKRLIFPGKHGKPNGHALRIVKRLALRAGVNCGQCVNKKGLSCSQHPVCRNFLLHKMRKTFASTLHHKGLPAQTLQRYLRHSDLDTTLKYIADQPDDQVRETINATFSGFAWAGGAT
jgi:integrase/recombinase XerD